MKIRERREHSVFSFFVIIVTLFFNICLATESSKYSEDEKKYQKLRSIVDIEEDYKLKNSQRIIDLLNEVSQLKENENYVRYLQILQKVDLEQRLEISPHFLKLAISLENRINLDDLLKKLISLPSSDYNWFTKLTLNFRDYKGSAKILTMSELDEIYNAFGVILIEERDAFLSFLKSHQINNFQIAQQLSFAESESWRTMLMIYKEDKISLYKPNLSQILTELDIFQEDERYDKLKKYCQSVLKDELKYYFSSYHSSFSSKESIKEYLDRNFKRILGDLYQSCILKSKFYKLIDAMHLIYDDLEEDEQ